MERSKYKGKIFEVFGKEVQGKNAVIDFEIARRAPGTRLIIEKDNQVLLTKEFRHELNHYDYRLPGGKVFDKLEDYLKSLSNNEDIEKVAEEAAKKEAYEEAGIETKTLSLFHKSVCGATVIWDLYYFLVTEFDEVGQHLEEDEDVEVVWTSQDRVREMCLSGEISEERSALVLLRHLNFLKKESA